MKNKFTLALLLVVVGLRASANFLTVNNADFTYGTSGWSFSSVGGNVNYGISGNQAYFRFAYSPGQSAKMEQVVNFPTNDVYAFRYYQNYNSGDLMAGLTIKIDGTNQFNQPSYSDPWNRVGYVIHQFYVPAGNHTVSFEVDDYLTDLGYYSQSLLISNLTISTACVTTNAALTYYGLRTTNYPAAPYTDFGWIPSSTNETAWFPPVQVRFVLHGSNVLFNIDRYHYATGNDDAATYMDCLVNNVEQSSYPSFYTRQRVPNSPYHSDEWVELNFTNVGDYDIRLNFKGGFGGLWLPPNTTISKYTGNKPNLLMVLGDSYTEGYAPSSATSISGEDSRWFEGWVWDLTRLNTNLVVAPVAISGTGFSATGGGSNYAQRVVAEVCQLYTNAVNSGNYNNIFITASGTINDRSENQGQVFTNAVYVYDTIKTACPQAQVFCTGNWYGGSGSCGPMNVDLVVDTNLANAASTVGLTYYSPVNHQDALLNSNTCDIFFGSDVVHPSTTGYALMAYWINTNLVSAYGTNWGSAGGSGYSSVVSGGGSNSSSTNVTSNYVVTTPGSSSNILLNSSFELPLVANANPSGLSSDGLSGGWSFSGIGTGRAGIASTNANIFASPPFVADGIQAAFLDMSYAGDSASISQSFTTAVTTNFALSFWRGQYGGKSMAGLTVKIDGADVGYWPGNGDPWNHVGFVATNFTIAAGSHTILFAGDNGTGPSWYQFGVLLDQVQLYPTNTPYVPLYALTVNNGLGSTNVPNGTVVQISANFVSGKHFVAWSGGIGTVSNAFVSPALVTMSSNAVTVTPYYVSNSAPSGWIDATDIGAKNDTTNFLVATVSNSVVIGTPIVWDTNATIGKIMEVFIAGPWVYWSNNPAQGVFCTNQDVICLITNVTDGTNLWGSIPMGWTTNLINCTVGSNNKNALQTAIDVASNTVASGTNTTIYFPNGKYLCVNDKVLNPGAIAASITDAGPPSLIISIGGITFLGQSTNAVLLGCGAGMEHRLWNGGDPANTWPYGQAGAWIPLRGALFQCNGTIRHSELPLVFQNLTLDGGVQQGFQDYRYWILYPGNGEGWDTTHHGLIDANGNGTPGDPASQMHQLKVFTNCVFQHWRGEMVICTTGKGGTNTFNDIANCSFYDGSASANNLYYGQHVHGCHFELLEKVAEYYQYNASLPVLYENNVWTNLGGSALSIVGSTTNENPSSFTIRNNSCADDSNGNNIQLSPAENVFIISNTFYGWANGVVITSAGFQPNDGTASVVSNIVINANHFTQSSFAITMDGYPTMNVTASNNVAANGFAAASAGWKTNIVFSGNVGGVLDGRGIQAGSYILDLTNNNFGTLLWDNGYYTATNYISYGAGRLHAIAHAAATFCLDDSDAVKNLIPLGATITVVNQDTSAALIYSSAKTFTTTSTAPGPSNRLFPGQRRSYNWDGSFWQAVSPGLPAPSNFR